MATARSVTVGDIIDWANYELRNTGKKQYADAEMIVYVNKALELLYSLLVDDESPLVRTGSGTITLEAGTNEYSLSDNSMGDLWIPHRVWTSGSDPLDLVPEEEVVDYRETEEDGDTNARTEPQEFYLLADKVGFLPYPDDEYIYNFLYYPNYTAVADRDDVIPYKNLFNQQIVETTKLAAKDREGTPIGIEAAMIQIFQERALRLSHRRDNRQPAITIRKR